MWSMVKRSSSICAITGCSRPSVHSATATQASQENTRSMPRANFQPGNTSGNTRASRRMPASEISTGTASRSRGTFWKLPKPTRAE